MSRKRFTDADKWEDEWFCEQTPTVKLFWIYLCDRCDQAGVWNVNWRLVGFHVGQGIQAEVEAALRGRITPIAEGRKWFIPGFIRFQYPAGLSEKSPVHLRIRKALLAHGIDPNDFIPTVAGTLAGTLPGTTEYEYEYEDKEDVFSGESAERGTATPPPEVPANLSPKLRETYREIAHAEGSGPAGFQAATRALRASQIQFGTPTPAQLNATYQAAREAGCVVKPPEQWPDFRKKIAAAKLRDQSKTTATHTADDAAQYAAIDERHKR